MKKISVLLLLLGLGSMALAQGISFGIKGGLNLSNLSGSNIGNSSYKTGMVGGAFATIDLMALKVQPELLYTQKGAKYETLFASATAQFDYLEVPVLLKYSFGAIIVPSILIGPSFGIPVKGSVEQTYFLVITDYTSSDSTVTVDVKKDLGPDLGLVFGAEIKTPFKLSVEARYTLGLSKIYKEVAGSQLDIKNSNISLMVGYSVF